MKVFLLDDVKSVCEKVSKCLETLFPDKSINLQWFYSSEDFIESLLAGSKKGNMPDLLLIDEHLGAGRAGSTVFLENIAANHQLCNIPTILFTRNPNTTEAPSASRVANVSQLPTCAFILKENFFNDITQAKGIVNKTLIAARAMDMAAQIAKPSGAWMKAGPLHLNATTRQLFVGKRKKGKERQLTPDLVIYLKLLIHARGAPVTRDQFLDARDLAPAALKWYEVQATAKKLRAVAKDIEKVFNACCPSLLSRNNCKLSFQDISRHWKTLSPLDRKKLSKTTLEQIWAKRDSSGTRREHIVEVLIEQRRRSVDTQINQLRKKIAPYRKSIQDHRKACVGGDEIDRVGGYKLNIDIV